MIFRDRKRMRELTAAIDQSRQLLIAGRYEENFEHLEKVVLQFPRDPEIRLLWATSLLGCRPDDVAAEAHKAVELDPDNPRILVRAAQLMLNRGAVESARAAAIRANELAQPDFVLMADLTNLNGLLAALDGENDVAEERLRSASETQPDNGPFAIDLARHLVAMGRQEETLAVIDQTLMRTDRSENLKRVRAEITEAGSSS